MSSSRVVLRTASLACRKEGSSTTAEPKGWAMPCLLPSTAAKAGCNEGAMTSQYTEMVFRLLAAVLVGGLIGLERSFHGRPAGFRTHTLVCTASSLLMLVTVYEALWFVPQVSVRVALDPTRMAQGIMTGIGFLGAGVIVKEGMSVRGLTTAASIWITAAIGILMGIGFYFPAAVATALT